MMFERRLTLTRARFIGEEPQKSEWRSFETGNWWMQPSCIYFVKEVVVRTSKGQKFYNTRTYKQFVLAFQMKRLNDVSCINKNAVNSLWFLHTHALLKISSWTWELTCNKKQEPIKIQSLIPLTLSLIRFTKIINFPITRMWLGLKSKEYLCDAGAIHLSTTD